MKTASDREVRRFRLKPLNRRSRGRIGPKEYFDALRRLNDRAMGEREVRRLRDILSFSDKDSDQRKDIAHVRERVAFAKALYVTRRISRQQYVFFASVPVEGLHDARFFDGLYQKELGPIDEALNNIRKKCGLGPDEFWYRADAPNEYRELEKQYEAILDNNFKKLLIELKLEDLLSIFERSQTEFDLLRERGRRSIFHADEYFLAVRDIVVQYEKEARQAAIAGAYSVAVTSLGAGLEGLLLIRCLRSPKKAARIAKDLPKRLRQSH